MIELTPCQIATVPLILFPAIFFTANAGPDRWRYSVSPGGISYHPGFSTDGAASGSHFPLNGARGSHSGVKIGYDVKWMGATFHGITDPLLRLFWQDAGGDHLGVIITKVPPNSKAAHAGLIEGDIVRSIHQFKIDNLSDFFDISNRVDIKNGTIINIRRHSRPLYLICENV
jgi:hypothetical protein